MGQLCHSQLQNGKRTLHITAATYTEHNMSVKTVRENKTLTNTKTKPGCASQTSKRCNEICKSECYKIKSYKMMSVSM